MLTYYHLSHKVDHCDFYTGYLLLIANYEKDPESLPKKVLKDLARSYGELVRNNGCKDEIWVNSNPNGWKEYLYKCEVKEISGCKEHTLHYGVSAYTDEDGTTMASFDGPLKDLKKGEVGLADDAMYFYDLEDYLEAQEYGSATRPTNYVLGKLETVGEVIKVGNHFVYAVKSEPRDFEFPSSEEFGMVACFYGDLYEEGHIISTKNRSIIKPDEYTVTIARSLAPEHKEILVTQEEAISGFELSTHEVCLDAGILSKYIHLFTNAQNGEVA